MAKLFKIKNEKLRWLAGAVITLVLVAIGIVVVCSVLWAIGYAGFWLDERYLGWGGFLYLFEDGDIFGQVMAGVMVLIILGFTIAAIYWFVRSSKAIGDKLFNSVNNKKEKTA